MKLATPPREFMYPVMACEISFIKTYVFGGLEVATNLNVYDNLISYGWLSMCTCRKLCKEFGFSLEMKITFEVVYQTLSASHPLSTCNLLAWDFSRLIHSAKVFGIKTLLQALT